MRRFRSSRSEARQRMAMISEAGVMSNPVSVGMPFAGPPKPDTMLRRLRSFTSRTRFHLISFRPKHECRF